MSASNRSEAISIPHRVARLLRFRLLTLLVAIILISAWLAWAFHRVPISPVNVSRLQLLDEIPCPNIYKFV